MSHRFVSILMLSSFLCIPSTATTHGASAAKHAVVLVPINDASEGELMKVPGVDREVARRIIAHRPYASIDQLVVAADLPLETVRVARQRFSIIRIVAPPEDSAPPRHEARPGGLGMRINVNTATAEELIRELAVDRKAAARIISARPYETLAAFLAVAHLPEPVVRRLTGKLVLLDSEPRVPASEPPPDPGSLNLQARPAPTPRPRRALADRLDINTVSREQLWSACGIEAMEANEIIRARPFHSLRELSPKLGYSKEQIERAGKCLRVVEPPG